MYEIKVLSNEEFDSLPVEATRGSDISESLGFANKFTGKAYVRYTVHSQLQKYLINHELEELTTDEHNHEDVNGIRHKKFKDIIRRIFNPFSFSDPITSLMGLAPSKPEPEQQAQEQIQQEQAPSSGFYSPQGQTGTSGSYGSPMNLFSGSGSYSPGQVPDAVSGSYTPGNLGSGLADLPEWQRQQLSGSEGGRLVF